MCEVLPHYFVFTTFSCQGTNKQFEWVFGKYEEALKAKAEAKDSKPENLLKIDKWFHTDLPKKLKVNNIFTFPKVCTFFKIFLKVKKYLIKRIFL